MLCAKQTLEYVYNHKHSIHKQYTAYNITICMTVRASQGVFTS